MLQAHSGRAVIHSMIAEARAERERYAAIGRDLPKAERRPKDYPRVIGIEEYRGAPPADFAKSARGPRVAHACGRARRKDAAQELAALSAGMSEKDLARGIIGGSVQEDGGFAVERRSPPSLFAFQPACAGRSRSLTVFTGLKVRAGTSTKTVFQPAIAPFHSPGRSSATSGRPS